MPYPDKPEISTSYTAHERSHPDQSFPGQELDVDLAALVAATNEVIDFLKGISRSDGALANGIVTPDSLAPGLLVYEPIPDSDYGDVIVAGGAWTLDPTLVATLKDRSEHTGTQLAATISDFSAAVAAEITGKQDALGFTPEDAAQKGIAGGYASLDGAGKVPAGQIPSVPAVIADGDYGDLTISGTGTAFTIDAGAVTYTKMQATVLGNVLIGKSGAAGTISEIQVGLNNWLGRGSSGNLTTLSPDGTTLEFNVASLRVVPGVFAAASHTHTAANVTDFAEAVDDRVGTLLTPGPGISLAYDDGAGTLTVSQSVRKKHVIFATGQSNIANHLAYAWTPAVNCFLWNFDGLVDAATVTGTAFSSMRNDHMAYGYSYAHEVAHANPDWDVYLVNIGISAMPISKWMTGGPSPDLYACCKNNVEAALTALGVSAIDEMLWWQGESDYTSTTYAADFETVHARFKAETWFREATPVAIATLTQNGVPSVSHMNSVIKSIVQAQPATRSLVDLGGQLSLQSWWTATDYLHLSAIGYEEAGKIAFDSLNGKGVLSAAQWRTILKHSSTARVSTTTLADDPHLKFPMKSGRSYMVRGRIIGSAPATPDFKWGLTGPTGTVILYFAQVMKIDTIATVVGRGGNGYPTGETVLQGSNGALMIDFVIEVLPATADGVFAFQWAQNTSDVGSTVVVAGSYIEYAEFG